METCELEKILNDISDLKYTTECSNTIFSGCEVAMHYNRDGEWTVWLTDSIDAEKYAASCAGQLDLYRQAVEATTGKKVLQTIIHLPNLGRCYEVKIAK